MHSPLCFLVLSAATTLCYLNCLVYGVCMMCVIVITFAMSLSEWRRYCDGRRLSRCVCVCPPSASSLRFVMFF